MVLRAVRSDAGRCAVLFPSLPSEASPLATCQGSHMTRIVRNALQAPRSVIAVSRSRTTGLLGDYLPPNEANAVIEATYWVGRQCLWDQVLLRLVYRHDLCQRMWGSSDAGSWLTQAVGASGSQRPGGSGRQRNPRCRSSWRDERHTPFRYRSGPIARLS
jgi:hypothetical protein